MIKKNKMEKVLKVGLIGFGNGGQTFHAPMIHAVAGLELSKIRAAKPDQIKVAEDRYPEATIVSESAEIFNDPNIDLVVISTPNTSHHPLGMQALQAGKHLVIDKPFTITTADADELIELASQKDKILSVFQSRRFDGDFLTIKKIIEQNLLGNIVEVESRYDRFRNYLKPNAWREEDAPGTGILYDLGAHLVDQAQALFGLPQAITADIRIQRKNAKATDNFELILHYPSLKFTVKGGMLVKQPLQRFIVLGDDGSFVKHGLDVQEDLLKAGKRPGADPDWGSEPSSAWGQVSTDLDGLHFNGFIETERGDYRKYYDNIYKTIIGKEQLIVTPLQARNNIRIIELAIKSQEERRTIDFIL